MPAIHVLDDYYLAITVLNSPAVTRYPQHRFGTGRDIAGVVMYSIGLGIETVSDAQKYRFRSTHDGKAVCDGGLFGVSRHPNCFWEIFVHFGNINSSSYRSLKKKKKKKREKRPG